MRSNSCADTLDTLVRRARRCAAQHCSVKAALSDLSQTNSIELTFPITFRGHAAVIAEAALCAGGEVCPEVVFLPHEALRQIHR